MAEESTRRTKVKELISAVEEEIITAKLQAVHVGAFGGGIRLGVCELVLKR